MSELIISERYIDDVTILDLTGKITIGNGSVTLQKKIAELLGKDQKYILLNFKNVEHIDPSGFGELVSCFIKVKKNGGSLKLFNLNPDIKKSLITNKLITVFDIYKNETETLASFNANPQEVSIFL